PDADGNSGLHIFAAVADGANSVSKRQRAGGDVCGIFAEGMSGDECGSKLRNFLLQNAERRDGNSQDRGLRNLSELELVFRTLEAKLRKFVAKRRIGFVECLP